MTPPLTNTKDFITQYYEELNSRANYLTHDVARLQKRLNSESGVLAEKIDLFVQSKIKESSGKRIEQPESQWMLINYPLKCVRWLGSHFLSTANETPIIEDAMDSYEELRQLAKGLPFSMQALLSMENIPKEFKTNIEALLPLNRAINTEKQELVRLWDQVNVMEPIVKLIGKVINEKKLPFTILKCIAPAFECNRYVFINALKKHPTYRNGIILGELHAEGAEPISFLAYRTDGTGKFPTVTVSYQALLKSSSKWLVLGGGPLYPAMTTSFPSLDSSFNDLKHILNFNLDRLFHKSDAATQTFPLSPLKRTYSF